ncbi:MAG: ATP-binding protein [Sphaerochaetaceae bacterium]|jgi:DNA replication protein DnaC
MTALGLMACNKDYKVKFFTVSQLVLLLKKALYDGTLENFLSILRAQDVLLLDELGYIPMDLESAQLLFRVVSESYERKALIITTNLPFSEWGKMFTDDELAAAMIDRIVHYGHLINTGNKDWRLENSLMLDKVREK